MAEKTNGFNAGGLFAGDNGKAFFDWMGKNQRAQEIFMGLLEEFGKGMGLQNQVAQVQLGNAAVAAAGFRPGQYVSARQRREAVLAATDPDKAAADKLARLQFHGGMANGKWTNNYDEWEAASENGHGTDSEGEEIKTKSFGFRVPTGRERILERMKKTGWDKKRVNKALARWAAKSGGDHRGLRIANDGSLIFTFGDPMLKVYNREREAEREAARRKELEENTSGEWMFDDEGRLKPSYAAVRGGQSGWLSMFGKDVPRAASKGGETMRERGWLDAVFARAERAAVRGGRTRR